MCFITICKNNFYSMADNNFNTSSDNTEPETVSPDFDTLKPLDMSLGKKSTIKTIHSTTNVSPRTF